jgi:hypothetical protein
MQLVRPVHAAHQRQFGRGPVRQLGEALPAEKSISDELKLFVTTFAAGFVFVSVLLA